MSEAARGGTHLWTAAIRDGNGAPADCGDLSLTVSGPDGEALAGFPATAPAVVRTGLGAYEYSWAVAGDAALGTYRADWSGTVDGLAVGGSDSVDVVEAGSVSAGLAYATMLDLQTSLARGGAGEEAWYTDQGAQALIWATDRLNELLGDADFWRHPAEGTETRLLAGGGSALLHVHGGVVSLASARVRWGRDGAWTDIDPGWVDLESRTAPDPHQPSAAAWPYDHLRLNDSSSVGAWPAGPRTVELTGAFGWPAVPRRAVEASVALARQIMAADRTFPGGTMSPDEAGRPVLPSRLPDPVYRLLAWRSGLHASCST